jgi:hypothetical protein
LHTPRYLREVILSAFTSGELPSSGHMFGVLSLMLHFTPEEVGRIQAHAAQQTRLAAGAGSVLGGLGNLVNAVGGLTSPLPTRATTMRRT